MKITKYIGMGAAVLLMSSCTGNFEEYNTNPYQPSTVPEANLLSAMFDVLASPQQNACQHNLTMWACHSGQVTATNSWGKGDGLWCYYNPVPEFNSATWGNFYGTVYANFFRIEDASQGQGLMYAVAVATKVYAMSIQASLQGPIPYTQIKQGKTEAPYDDEKTLWHAMLDDLDNAILTMKSVVASNNLLPELTLVDRFYKGDPRKWLRFANTLKLRMAIRISGVEPAYAQQKAEEAVADGVFETIDDSAWDTNNGNQGVNGFNVVDSWGEVKANACLVSYMNGYNDPRRPAYFTKADNGQYIGVRSGSVDLPSGPAFASYSRLFIATDKMLPQPAMYAAEAAFLRAEGALKGWNMGGTAKNFYEQGIRLSFEEYKVANVDAYLADENSRPANYVDPKYSGNSFNNQSTVTIKWNETDNNAVKLEKILTQKWIALFLDPMNGWADYRRTGYPRIFPATKSANPDCTTARGMRRAKFAFSEYNTNKANVEAAVQFLSNKKDSYGTDLWWALKENGQY